MVGRTNSRSWERKGLGDVAMIAGGWKTEDWETWVGRTGSWKLWLGEQGFGRRGWESKELGVVAGRPRVWEIGEQRVGGMGGESRGLENMAGRARGWEAGWESKGWEMWLG